MDFDTLWMVADRARERSRLKLKDVLFVRKVAPDQFESFSPGEAAGEHTAPGRVHGYGSIDRHVPDFDCRERAPAFARPGCVFPSFGSRCCSKPTSAKPTVFFATMH